MQFSAVLLASIVMIHVLGKSAVLSTIQCDKDHSICRKFSLNKCKWSIKRLLCPNLCRVCNQECFDLPDCRRKVARYPEQYCHQYWIEMICPRTCNSKICETTTRVPTTVTTTIESTRIPTTTQATTSSIQTTASTDSCGLVKVSKPRVINGAESLDGQWPWQVGIIRKGIFACGGSLISTDWILTAGHCVDKYSEADFKIELGATNSQNTLHVQRRDVGKILLHPFFNNPSILNNDIALMKLSKPVIITPYVRTVCLPVSNEDVKLQTDCFVSGWGKTSLSSAQGLKLHHAKLRPFTNSECKKTNNKYVQVTDNMFCTVPDNVSTKQSHCHGDDGGPFVCENGFGRWTLCGVVSWGAPNCDDSTAKSVFTKVANYIQWINNNYKN